MLETHQIMNEVITVKVEDLVEKNPSWLAYNHDIAIVDFKNMVIPNSRKDLKLRLEAMSIIVVLDGKIEININGNDYNFESNVLFDIAKLHTFSNIKLSHDCRGYHVILSSDYTKDILGSIKRLGISTFISRYDYPIELLNTEESDLLEDMIIRVIKSIKCSGHKFHNDLVKNNVRGFIIEVMNIIMQRSENTQGQDDNSNNKIIGKFLFLLDEYCKKEHSVEFYAEKLCVEAKYLSRILKKLNGKTASVWISEAILKEAKIYMKDPYMTIQQIADMLNFSDQSSFGKFFKKHCGMSPMNYRSSINEM